MIRRHRIILIGWAPAICLAGCAGTDLSTGSIAPYEAANSFYPYGYRDTVVGENQYQVIASGSASASKTRLEKIALRRAAEIGVDKKKKYMKVGTIVPGVACNKKQALTHKGREAPASARVTMTLEATYADAPLGPDFRETQVALDEYKAALDAETASANPEDAAAVNAQCGV